MRRIFKLPLLYSLIMALIVNGFTTSVSFAADAPDTIQVVTDQPTLKQIKSTAITVSMNNNGQYGLILNPNTNAFYNGAVSTTSNIDVKINNDAAKSWYQLPVESGSYKIENNKIMMSRVDNITAPTVRYTLILSIVNATAQGAYMKVEMKMENLSGAAKALGTFIYWDTMIGNNDMSPFVVIENGWRNYDGNFQVSAFFKDTAHVTNADSIWMGQWGSMGWTDNPEMSWSQHASRIGQVISDGDTAAAAWYKPVTVAVGSSRTISTIVGAGPKNDPPKLGATNIGTLNGNVYRGGDTVTFSGTASDSDTVGNTVTVLASIDDGEGVVIGTMNLTSQGTPFSFNYTIPDNLAGSHTLNFWMMDTVGGTSALQQANITILAVPDVASQDVQGGAAVTILNPPEAGNTIWLAPAGTTEFAEGVNMTSIVADGEIASIRAPEADGQYLLYVVNAQGHIESVSRGIVTVDNIAPAQPVLDTEFAKGGQTITLPAPPQEGETAWLAPAGTTTFTQSSTATKLTGDGGSQVISVPTEQGVYQLYYIDAAGNVSSPSENSLIVDNTAPVIGDLTPSTAEWTNEDVTITTSFSDAGGSDVAQVKYAYGNQDAAYFAAGGTPIVNEAFKATQSGAYTVYVVDGAGNAALKTITISNIDKTSPSDPVIVRSPNSDFYNGTYSITIDPGSDANTGANTSGLQDTLYRLLGAETLDWTTYEESFSISAQGMTAIEVVNYDRAGNASASVTSVVYINSNATVFPSIAFSPDKLYSNTDIAVNIAKDHDGSNEEEAQYATVYYQLNGVGDFVPYDVPFVIASEGRNELTVKVVDRYGNESSVTRAVYLDKTAPTNQDLVFATSMLSQSGKTISIAPSSDESDTIWLAPAGTTVFAEGDSMTSVSGSANEIVVPELDGEYKVFVVDSYGNISEPSLATLTVDNTPPVVFGVSEGGSYQEYPTITFSDGTATLNGEPFANGSTVGTNGNYELIVTDAAGNSTIIAFAVRNDQEIVDRDLEALEIGYAEGDSESWVKGHLTLPTQGYNGSAIAWSSSDDSIISADGTVYMPSRHTYVTLTATITSGEAVEVKTFRVRAMSNTVAPIITLNGSGNIEIEKGKLYVEQGVQASDAQDGNLTDSVQVSGFVNTDKLGTYILIYSVEDSNGNITEVERTVKVVDKIIDTNATIIADNLEKLTNTQVSGAINAAINSGNDTVKIVVNENVTANQPVKVSISKEQVENAQPKNIHLQLETANASIEVPLGSIDTTLLNGNSRLELVIEQVDTSKPENQQLVDAVEAINSMMEIYEGKVFDFTMKVIEEDANGNVIDEQPIAGFRSEEDIKLRIVVGTVADGDTKFMTYYYNPATEAWEYIRSSYEAANGAISLFTNHLSIYSVMSMTKAEKQEEMAKVLNKPGVTIQEVLNVIEDPDMEFDAEAVEAYSQFTRKHTEDLAQQLLDNKPGGGYNYAKLYEAYEDAVLDKQAAIISDTVSPSLTLKGQAQIFLSLGASYTEPGAEAFDDQDGDLTGRIVIHGTVDTTKVGEYVLRYVVTDLSGNQAELTRKVVVTAPFVQAKQDTKTSLEVVEGEKAISAKSVELTNAQKPTSAGMKLIGSAYDLSVVGADDSYEGVVKIQYPKELSNVDQLVVFVYDEVSKEWKAIGGIVDKDNRTITVNVKAPSRIALMENVVTFKDLEGHWSKGVVEALAARGIITGDDQGNFNPNIGISRAEFATLVVRVLGLPVDTQDTGFTDISAKDWFAAYIAAGRKAGVVKGVSETEYEPSRIVNRQEMAAIVIRAYSTVKGAPAVDSSQAASFDDTTDISGWAYEDVYAAKSLNIIQGRLNNKFAPKSETLRGEAASLIYQLMKSLGQN